MHLREIAAEYCSVNDFSQSYEAHLLRTAKRFCHFVGRNVQSLNYQSVNEWLRNEVALNKRLTAYNYRKQLITLLNFAADHHGWEMPHTRKIKRIKRDLPEPSALHPENIEKLLGAAARLTGRYECGSKADYWRAVIVGGYDIGARRADMWMLPRSIVHGKPFTYVCQKERIRHRRRLSPLGCEFLRHLKSSKRAYPWELCPTSWAKTVRRIGEFAGFEWQFKQLRKTHGTLAGTLNHRSHDVFVQFYRDESILDLDATGPPQLSLGKAKENHDPV